MRLAASAAPHLRLQNDLVPAGNVEPNPVAGFGLCRDRLLRKHFHAANREAGDANVLSIHIDGIEIRVANGAGH
jgi:hypothetical protein